MQVADRLRLMAVHAHPDDESSKGAATMAKYAGTGYDVLVVSCTGGERGDVLNPRLKGDPHIERDLAQVRREEMKRSEQRLTQKEEAIEKKLMTSVRDISRIITKARTRDEEQNAKYDAMVETQLSRARRRIHHRRRCLRILLWLGLLALGLLLFLLFFDRFDQITVRSHV